MIRTSILSLATVVLTGALANGAAPPKPGVEAGFRVYTISYRCGNRTLVGVHPTAGEAFEAAVGARAKTSAGQVEVTTGSEGKTLPGRQAPALYEVYQKSCRAGWMKQPTLYTDEKKVEAAAADKRKLGNQIEVVRDYAPKEVYHVYGLPCRSVVGTKSRLQGTYRTAKEAIDVAETLRSTRGLRCEVTTGTKGQELLDGAPTQYTVYSRGCKGALESPTTTSALEKAVKDYQARIEQKSVPVMVVHYAK